MAKDILILIHGMIPDRMPSSPEKTYDAFWQALKASDGRLGARFSDPIRVQWGHELPNEATPAVRDDQKLTLAEQFVFDRTAYENVARVHDRNNELRTDLGIPVVHWGIQKVRESIVTFGITDVLYYAAPDGEARVRQQVYEQVLRALEPYREEDLVRLHVFGHSLGATIAHDFLFGLFNDTRGYEPGFVAHQQGSDAARRLFKEWRDKRKGGGVRLGGLATAACQLPLLLLRSQTVVDAFYEAKRASMAARPAIGLDPSNIGVVSSTERQWANFYDTDDLLGFATRGLYTLPSGAPHPAIADLQVNCGYDPLMAHDGYWTNPDVVREAADLFAFWSGDPEPRAANIAR